jgi:hypothetical protein
MVRLWSAVLVVVLASLVAVAGASADTVTASFVSTTGTGPFAWNYMIAEDSFGRVVTGTVPGASTSFSAPNTVADYFTIYDFVGFTGAHSEPAGWAFESLPTGSTDTNVSPTDNAGIVNLTWYYTGAAPLVGPFTLGGFSATSTFSLPNVQGFFTSEDTQSGGAAGTDGLTTAAIGPITVPTNVPEPATLLLVGTGLASAGFFGRKRVRTKPTP